MYFNCEKCNRELETHYPNFASRFVGRRFIEYALYKCRICDIIYGKELYCYEFKELQKDTKK